MTETLTDHLITQRFFTYFFVGAVSALGLLSLIMLYILAKQGQLLRSMLRKCEKMQKQIGSIAVSIGQLQKGQEFEQRGGNRNQNKNTLKVSQPESVTDGLYNALNRMQDKIDEQEQELRELRAKGKDTGLKAQA